MRHDWTLLCTNVRSTPLGAIGLDNVLTRIRLAEAGTIAEGASFPLVPPLLLVSHWTAEFRSDHRVHPALIQLLAPGGEYVLWEDSMELDLRNRTAQPMIYEVTEIPFVGPGTYEFHVSLGAMGFLGEWGRASLDVR